MKGFIPIILLIGVLALGILAVIISKKVTAPKEPSSQERSLDQSFADLSKNQQQQTPLSTPSPMPQSTDKPPTPTTSIAIKGDANCVSQTNQSLNLLKEKASIHYAVITKYVGVIECSESGSGMYAWEKPPRYLVGKATRDTGTIWYAGTIAHDSCHSKQYHDYLSNNQSVATVPNDVWTGKEAERQCLDVQYDALTKIGADESTLNYVKNIINSEYWNVSYDNRWW